MNSKALKSVLVANNPDFIHPFSSLPPLNAIKKIAHTPAARTRSTTKVCIFKPLCFRTTFWPANLWATRHDNPLGCFLLASSSIEARFEVAVAVDDKERGRQPKRPLHVCASELLELVPQFIKPPFLHAHPNGRQFAISLRQPANRVAA